MEYDIRPLQLHLLDILLSFQQVCEKQGLKYYMVDGSLLGAIKDSFLGTMIWTSPCPVMIMKG